MNEGNKRQERRKYPRLDWSFVIKVRLKGSNELWQTTSITNISEGGCYFPSSQAFAVGNIVEMEIQIPRIQEPMYFSGEVKRCEAQKRGLTQIYGIAVQFQHMDKEKKSKFVEAIAFLLKKQSKKGGTYGARA